MKLLEISVRDTGARSFGLSLRSSPFLPNQLAASFLDYHSHIFAIISPLSPPYPHPSGPAIPESVRSRIFEMPNTQEDCSDQSGAHALPHSVGQSSATITGTGLGLHVAKRLAEMIGGNLRCESGMRAVHMQLHSIYP